jgi:hypothetical protein
LGVEFLWQDVCYSFRSLFRNRVFTAVAVLLLALSIGANSAVFSIMDAMLFKMLPVKSPEELVQSRETLSYPAFVLFIQFIATLARLLGPGGVRSIVAESLLLKHQQILKTSCSISGPTSTTIARIPHWKGERLIRPCHDKQPISARFDGNPTVEPCTRHRPLPDF